MRASAGQPAGLRGVEEELLTPRDVSRRNAAIPATVKDRRELVSWWGVFERRSVINSGGSSDGNNDIVSVTF